MSRAPTGRPPSDLPRSPLARLREGRGMTQAALAWQARTTQGTVTQLETGRRTVAGVSLGLANRLAGALGIGLEEWAELAGMRGVAYSRHVTEAEWAEPPADTSGEPGDPPGDDSTAPDGATEEEQQ